jgi:hypothetical protein
MAEKGRRLPLYRRHGKDHSPFDAAIRGREKLT